MTSTRCARRKGSSIRRRSCPEKIGEMIRIGNNQKPPTSLGQPVATIGTFDGVHKGHRRVLADLRKWASELATTSLVVTFDRNPKTLTRSEHVPCITSLEHRLVLFERLGVDACAVLEFDASLRRMPARDFVVNILRANLRAQGMLLGFNCRFGRNGEGDYALLRRLAAEGVCLARRSARPALAGGVPVSSSAIRKAIEQGQFHAAEKMLGRPVSLLGTVVRGRGRGAGLGFPTANLDLHHEVNPPSGVYVCSARVETEWLPALISIGPQPTFPRLQEEVVEVYIQGFGREVYGRDIEVRFVRKLRDQIKFASPEELADQIRKDAGALEGGPQ